MKCAGRAYCKLYKDKSQCKKVNERQKGNGICDCRHARYLCEVDDCLFSHVRGTLYCEPKDWDKLYEEYIVREIMEGSEFEKLLDRFSSQNILSL